MPDYITHLGLALADWLQQPEQKVALSAAFMSAVRVITSGGLRNPKRWGETVMVTFLAWTSLPIIQHYGYEEETGRFIAAFLGYIGVHGFEKRIDKLLDNLTGWLPGRRK
ncbi:phage holin family protein [Salinicola halophyticus]|uniref:phage holin family protein n=1 Tax=Salinicola halophyticus TaxID=1808881 RepID=UPI000DA22E55|nr:phage holin family protein [Salinicola halophyticus]